MSQIIPRPAAKTPEAIALMRRMLAAQLELWDASTELETLLGQDIDSHSEHLHTHASGCDTVEDATDYSLAETLECLLLETDPNPLTRH